MVTLIGVGAGHEVAGRVADLPGGQAGVVVQRDGEVGLREALVQIDRAASPSAPFTTSSAGWPISISVPCHCDFSCASILRRAEERGHVDVVSAGVHHRTSSPVWLFARTVLAYGRPVCSATGSASMSLRTSTRRTGAVPHDGDDAVAGRARLDVLADADP